MSVKMIRASGVLRCWCRSRRRSCACDEPGGACRAAWNQGCWSDVWLITSSVTTRMPALVRLADELAELLARAVAGVDAVVVGDVVAVVAQGRRVERQEPEAGDPQVLEVVELLDQPGEVADAVVVAVEERLDVQLVDDGILVPERVGDIDSWRIDSSSRRRRMVSSCGIIRRRFRPGYGRPKNRRPPPVEWPQRRASRSESSVPSIARISGFVPATGVPRGTVGAADRRRALRDLLARELVQPGPVGQGQGRPLPASPEPDRQPRRDGDATAAIAAAREGDDMVPLRTRRRAGRVVAFGSDRTIRAGGGGGGAPGGSGGAWACPSSDRRTIASSGASASSASSRRRVS